mmetsp:Transcript_13346/g.49939  ORF Transcript_13346/g.49939 Transcript_13346/m.49939 type:complete len:255 (+) Transcript_13346:2932-3696(+)
MGFETRRSPVAIPSTPVSATDATDASPAADSIVTDRVPSVAAARSRCRRSRFRKCTSARTSAKPLRCHAICSAPTTDWSESSDRMSSVCRTHAMPGLGNMDSLKRSRTWIGSVAWDESSPVSGSDGYNPETSACADCTVRRHAVARIVTAPCSNARRDETGSNERAPCASLSTSHFLMDAPVARSCASPCVVSWPCQLVSVPYMSVLLVSSNFGLTGEGAANLAKCASAESSSRKPRHCCLLSEGSGLIDVRSP